MAITDFFVWSRFCSVVCKELLQVNKNQEIKDNTQDIIRESSKEIQRVSNYTSEGKFKLVSNHWDTRFVGVNSKQLRCCIMPSVREGRHRTFTSVGRRVHSHNEWIKCAHAFFSLSFQPTSNWKKQETSLIQKHKTYYSKTSHASKIARPSDMQL